MRSFEDIFSPMLREAGRIMLSAHNVDESSDNISVKPGSANFVTVYDVRVQECLIERIRECFPDAAFIAEEKENDSEVLASEHCFIIDPIDGTTNFIHDYRHSCISLAIVSRGETVFGAIYDPYLDELFTAERGKGAYLNGKKIQVSDRPMELCVAAYGTAPYYRDTLADATFSMCRDVFMACADVRRCGSAALDLAYMAAGRNDLFFEVVLSPWDIAAGALLITEAGGIITDMQGSPIDLSKPCSVIAANKQAYGSLLEIAKRHSHKS